MPTLHRLWRYSVAATLATGMFHLINLVGPGRGVFGPAMLTPFRLAFALAWGFLVAGMIAGRRRPRLDGADYLVLGLVAFFMARAFFAPETLTTTLNWLVTGAGVFFLIKHGVRDQADVRLVTVTAAVCAVVAAAIGLMEYIFKSNPLFDSVEISIIGADSREIASSQLYRIRSVIGHPGFVGAIAVAGVPLAMLAFWRRRWLMSLSLMALGAALFLSFSRGSWLVAILFLLPVLIYRSRFWLRRNARWLAPVIVLPSIFITVDYLNREEVSATLGRHPQENGLVWSKGGDGPYQIASGEADGALPLHKFFYFDVDDDFFREERSDATVIIHFYDRGNGAVHVDYDSWDEQAAGPGGSYKQSGSFSKSDSHMWTTAAFYLSDPRFGGRENTGTDFRIVDDDNQMVLHKVVLQKGKLKLPSVVAQQWHSRASSFELRMDLIPFAWNVFRENPLGVGQFNTPGSDHHAIDSLPLTWLIEFGWLGIALMAGLVAVTVREGIRVWRARQTPVIVMYLALLLLLLHGGHLMVLYDKPSLVLFGAVGAIYALIRPGAAGVPELEAGARSYML